MDRLFLDANVLFSAAYTPDARLRELWMLRDVEIWTSRYALEEARVNLSDEVQRKRLLELSESLQFREAGERGLPARIALPEKDRQSCWPQLRLGRTISSPEMFTILENISARELK